MNQSNKSRYGDPSDSIWKFHQSTDCNRFAELLDALLTAGKLELAIELLKLERLDSIANSLEEIEIALRDRSTIE